MYDRQHNGRILGQARASAVVVAAACAALAGFPALGQETFFNVAEGDWADPSSWTDGVPHSGLGAQIDNSGTALITQSDQSAAFVHVGEQSGQSGRIEISPSGTLNTGAVAIGRSGSGSLLVDGGDLNATGVLRVGQFSGSSGEVEVLNGNVTFGSTYHIGSDGNGTFVQSGGTVTFGSSGRVGLSQGTKGTIIQSGGLFHSTGNLQVGFHGTGTYTKTDGDLLVNTFLKLGAEPTGVGHFVQSGGDTTVATLRIGHQGLGAFEMSGGTLNTNSFVHLGRDGSGTGDGTYIQSGGTANIGGFFLVGAWGAGTVELSGGQLNINNDLELGVRGTSSGTYTQTGGQLSVSQNFLVGVSRDPGSIRGNATIGGGSVNVAQNLQVGDDFSTEAVLEISGSGAEQISVGGSFLANQSGGNPQLRFGIDSGGISLISVGGSADLSAATIDLHLLDGFVPSSQQTFDLVTASSIIGGALSPASTSDWSLDIVGGGNGQILQATYLADVPLLPGDANRDGRVDGEDFLIWQASFGIQQGATWDDGDFNGDGRVDGEDFLIWQAHFGSVAESSAVTPEPAALAALILGGGLLMRRRHSAGSRAS